jgi:CHAD domain-containing protein
MPPAQKQTVEREIKLKLTRGFRFPRLPGGRIPPRILTSTYYDTADYRLIRAGLSLRYRVEARTGVWQLKLPRNGTRSELEFAGGRNNPPESLSKLLVAHLRGQPLKPITKLRTRRTGFHVRGKHGEADVVLDAVVVMNDGRVVRHFSELEAELTGGDRKQLRQIEKTLRKAGAQKTKQTPKVFQALGLAFPMPEVSLTPSLPPIEHLKAKLKIQLRHLLIHDVGTRLGTDPEGVHQMRVGTRRLRAYLRAARSMVSPEWANSLRGELAWLNKKLGPIRDLDVLEAHLRSEGAGLPPHERRALMRVLKSLEQDRADPRRALLEALESDRYLTLIERIEAAENSPVVTNPDASLAEIARSAFKKLARAMSRRARNASDAELHRIRIKGKRARYTTELAQEEAGKSATRLISQLKAFQDLLGEHHDALVAEERLRKLVASPCDTTTAFILGRLIERQRERRREVRTALPTLWAKVKKCGHKVWN